MSKLNMFQRDALILLTLLLLHVGFALTFPLRSIEAGSTVTISREWAVFTIQNGDSSITYIPVLTMIYVAILIGLLFKKQKPLTLIYGIGLMLLTKMNFLSELSNMAGTHQNVIVSNWLMPTVQAGSSTMAQDITFVVILALLAIKLSIIAYDIIKKRFNINHTVQNRAHQKHV